MEQITSSYNLFVDSSTGHNAQTKGDDYIVNLQDAGVHAGEGEHIRMSLSGMMPIGGNSRHGLPAMSQTGPLNLPIMQFSNPFASAFNNPLKAPA